MIMKLELKHLAPYLPYGLKFYWEQLDGTPNKPWTLTINSIEFALENQNKPILRPLSDLTKEIEHNGEKLIPYDWFDEHEETNYFEDSMWVKYLFEYEKGDIIDLDLIPYGVICKLLEWHLDIFGLIPHGLAIDINTL